MLSVQNSTQSYNNINFQAKKLINPIKNLKTLRENRKKIVDNAPREIDNLYKKLESGEITFEECSKQVVSIYTNVIKNWKYTRRK